jgi:hypothetical protein
MPGVYKLKNCPQCNKEHRKKGPYCSQGCHNSHREVSDKQREQGHKLGELTKENAGAPDKIATGHLLKQGLITPAEDFAIQIPELHDLPEGYDIADKW